MKKGKSRRSLFFVLIICLVVLLSCFFLLKDRFFVSGNVISDFGCSDCDVLTIYVSGSGSDSNSGNITSPLATFIGARDKIRTLRSEGYSKNIIVYFRQGVYYQNQTLLLGLPDSANSTASITYSSYPGEIAIISGGEKLANNWQLYSGNIYSTHVDSNFSSLFLGFERLTRARSPNSGFYTGSASSSSADKKYAFNFSPRNINSTWRNLKDVEVISLIKWEQNRFKINTVSGNKVYLTGGMDPRWGNSFAEDYSAGNFRYFVDNVFEGLDSPGEWYLDKTTSTLYYWPRDISELSNGSFIIPKLNQLLIVSGVKNNQINNITFQNLVFSHTDWMMHNSGYGGSQAGIGIYSPSALLFNYTNNSKFINNFVTLTGAYALESNSEKFNISGNQFSNLGAGAIRVGKEDKFSDGSSWPPSLLSELDAARANVISNNKIYDMGKVFKEGVGIWVALSGYNVIENNLIYNGSYSGISVGWKWGISDTRAKNNVIQRNIIHDVMRELNDGAGIYTLGKQTGTVIRYNFIYDIIKTQSHSFSTCEYCIQGIHMDEGSSAMVVHNNIIKNTFNGIVLNVGSGNDIHHNIFAYQSNYLLFWNQLKTTVGYNRFRANSYYAPSAKGLKFSSPSDDATFSEFSFSQMGSAPVLNPDSSQGTQVNLDIDLASLNNLLILNICGENDWNFSLNPSVCPSTGQQTKSWNKIRNCDSGVNHPSSEVVSCTYVPMDLGNNVIDNTPSPVSCNYTYSSWSSCNSSGVQVRSIALISPPGCSNHQTLPLIQDCSLPCNDSDWTYRDSDCDSSGIYLRIWSKKNNCDSNLGVNMPEKQILSCVINSGVVQSPINNVSLEINNSVTSTDQIDNTANYSSQGPVKHAKPKSTLNEKGFIGKLLCKFGSFFNRNKYESCIYS